MFKNVVSWVVKNKFLIIILFISIVLRLTNLGYADYQGDEIKALFLPTEEQTTKDFLLDQRKGPMQFLITYALKLVNPTYDNEFLVRLPFALAGIFSVYFFYKLIKRLFGEEVAFFSSFFLATNGFFIAFSRIVQYQSFVVLFAVLALYFLDLRKIYLGLIFWSLSILSHYDGIFIFPFAFYLIFKYLKEKGILDKKIHFKKAKDFIVAGLFSLSLILLFYIPFVLTLSDSTMDYWSGRITGDVSSKLSSSKYLFTVYQPIYAIHIYIGLFVLGLLFMGILLSKNRLPKAFKFLENILLNKIDVISALFKELFFVLLWFLISFVFMEGIVYIPGTHIYTYLIPCFVFLGFGVFVIKQFVYKIFKERFGYYIFSCGVFLIFTFLLLQSYAIFVEHNTEYPWEQESFLIWTLPKPTPIYHLSMFGFPYFRNWEGIRDFVKQHPEVTAYSTNERKSIARYYVGNLPKDSTLAGFYVYIKNPQSFTNEILNEKPNYWVQLHKPDYVFSRRNRDYTEVYIMTPGILEGIESTVSEYDIE